MIANLDVATNPPSPLYATEEQQIWTELTSECSQAAKQDPLLACLERIFDRVQLLVVKLPIKPEENYGVAKFYSIKDG